MNELHQQAVVQPFGIEKIQRIYSDFMKEGKFSLVVAEDPTRPTQVTKIMVNDEASLDVSA